MRLEKQMSQHFGHFAVDASAVFLRVSSDTRCPVMSLNTVMSACSTNLYPCQSVYGYNEIGDRDGEANLYYIYRIDLFHFNIVFIINKLDLIFRVSVCVCVFLYPAFPLPQVRYRPMILCQYAAGADCCADSSSLAHSPSLRYALLNHHSVPARL